MKPQEVTDALKLTQLKDKIWFVVPSCATTGEGLLEGLVCQIPLLFWTTHSYLSAMNISWAIVALNGLLTLEINRLGYPIMSSHHRMRPRNNPWCPVPEGLDALQFIDFLCVLIICYLRFDTTKQATIGSFFQQIFRDKRLAWRTYPIFKTFTSRQESHVLLTCKFRTNSKLVPYIPLAMLFLLFWRRYHPSILLFIFLGRILLLPHLIWPLSVVNCSWRWRLRMTLCLLHPSNPPFIDWTLPNRSTNQINLRSCTQI